MLPSLFPSIHPIDYAKISPLDEDHSDTVVSYVGDICQPDMIEHAFEGVHTVFHAAGLISIQYPIDYQRLYDTNIKGNFHKSSSTFINQKYSFGLLLLLLFKGSLNIVDLCVQKNIKHLIYTSCASVCLVPFKGRSTFSLIINQTESKAVTPQYNAQETKKFENEFILSAYSASKLRAEAIILNSNGTPLYNRKDYLTTTAIRPPLTYGEGDNHFIPRVLEFLKARDYVYPRVSGPGGKHQIAYAGKR